MTPKTVFRVLIAIFMLVVVPAQASAPVLDQEVIAYRQQIMKALDAQFKAMAGIIAFGGPAENLTSHLETSLILARQILPSFEKHAPGGTSEPKIWSDWDGYASEAYQFEAAIALAIEAAKFASVRDVVWYTDQISCRQCHDTYKQRGVRGGQEYLGY